MFLAVQGKTSFVHIVAVSESFATQEISEGRGCLAGADGHLGGAFGASGPGRLTLFSKCHQIVVTVCRDLFEPFGTMDLYERVLQRLGQ